MSGHKDFAMLREQLDLRLAADPEAAARFEEARINQTLPPREQVEGWFRFHPATTITGPIHDSIRTEFRELFDALWDLLPECADRTLAMRKLQEAMWAANSCIANNAQQIPEDGDYVRHLAH